METGTDTEAADAYDDDDEREVCHSLPPDAPTAEEPADVDPDSLEAMATRAPIAATTDYRNQLILGLVTFFLGGGAATGFERATADPQPIVVEVNLPDIADTLSRIERNQVRMCDRVPEVRCETP